MVVDYSRTKIYSIRSPHTNKLYIGATTKKYLSKRLAIHRAEYKQFLNGKRKTCCSSRLILELGEAYIQLEEKFPCESIEESNKKEREWVDKFGELCVNNKKPGRTKREYYEENREKTLEKVKEYSRANKDKISTRMKKYYKQNREKIQAQQREPFTCPHCSTITSYGHKARHFRTKVCQAAREAQEDVEIIYDI